MSLFADLRKLVAPSGEAATGVLWLVAIVAVLVALSGSNAVKIATAAWFVLP